MEILYFAHGENCFSFIYDICCKQKINVVLYKSPCFISSFYKKSPGYRDFIVTSRWFCTFLLWWMLWCYPAGGLSQRPQSVPVVVSLHVCPLWKGCTSRSLGSYPLAAHPGWLVLGFTFPGDEELVLVGMGHTQTALSSSLWPLLPFLTLLFYILTHVIKVIS